MDRQEKPPQEDWLLDSLEKYEGVYIFELQYPTSLLEWTPHATSVWMVSMVRDKDSEILQLALPERLLPQEKQTLWAKRDFKLVNGVLVKSRITSIKHFPGSEGVVSGDGNAKVQVWDSDGANPDLLQCVDQLNLSTKDQAIPSDSRTLLDISPSYPSLLLSGLSPSLHSLKLHDLTSKSSLFSLPSAQGVAPEFLHALSFLDPQASPHTLVTCSGHAQRLAIWDYRKTSAQQPSAVTPIQPEGSTYTQCSLGVSGCGSPSPQLAVLTKPGTLTLYDSRNLHSPMAKCQLSRRDGGGTNGVLPLGFSRWFGQQSTSVPPCVQFSPGSCHVVSVSGTEDGVKVYDTSTWSCDTASPTPMFWHEGHSAECSGAEVLVHSWQPGVGGATILSVDTLANLHAWQWKLPQDKLKKPVDHSETSSDPLS